jgi:hypothetical protein
LGQLGGWAFPFGSILYPKSIRPIDVSGTFETEAYVLCRSNYPDINQYDWSRSLRVYRFSFRHHLGNCFAIISRESHEQGHI